MQTQQCRQPLNCGHLAEIPDTIPAMTSPIVQRLEQLGRWRKRHEPDIHIGKIVDRLASESRQAQRRLGDLVTAWEAAVPRQLLGHTRLIGVSRGALQVVVDSSAVRYRLERELNNGVLSAIRIASGGSVANIRIRVEVEASEPLQPSGEN